MEEVRTKRVMVRITKKGRPVAKLVPVTTTPTTCSAGSRVVPEIVEDVESPMVASEDREALR
jgi:antitoxin (DNA-binding transcriptional repressor) of toxin-antitoxin stability system